MVIFKAVNEIPVEVAYQTVRGVLSARDAARSYLDRVTGASDTCLALWVGAQQAGLRNTFDVQNSVTQALQTWMLDTLPSGRRAFRYERVAFAPPLPPERPVWPVAPSSAAPDQEEGHFASALNFMPPLGIIAEGYEGPEDGS